MKKFISILFVIAMFMGPTAFGQDSIQLSDLYVPTSPGFVLADKSPSSIEKPTSIRAFGISLLNLREGGAIETTPFWLTNHPKYTFDDYVNNHVPILETFNISVASFKTDTSSSVSLGFKTQLLRFYPKNKIDSVKNIIVQLLSNEDLTPDILAKISNEKKRLDSLRKKPVFNLELAAAVIGSSKNNSFKNLDANKSGIWANIRFSPNKFPLDIIAVSRYSWANNANAKVGKDSAFLDFGVSLSLQKPRFDFSLEYVHRNDLSVKDNYHRLAFVTNYMLTENIVIVGSLGKNFDKVDNILALFGAKFGISNKKLKLNKD